MDGMDQSAKDDAKTDAGVNPAGDGAGGAGHSGSAGLGLPVMLSVAGRRCVVVGGGGVGVRRARALSSAGAQVVVVAPQVHPSARVLGVAVVERGFEPRDLDGAWLVVAATDDASVNDAVGRAASERGVLLNRADDGGLGDVMLMAQHRAGPLTVAVHSGGASANAAGRIRDLLVDGLDPDWAVLLEQALPVRRQIQKLVVDPAKRAGLIRRLTDDDAMAALKAGGVSALQVFYTDIMKGLAE